MSFAMESRVNILAFIELQGNYVNAVKYKKLCNI